MNAPAHRQRSEDGSRSRRSGAARAAIALLVVTAVTGVTAGVALAISHHQAARTRSAIGTRGSATRSLTDVAKSSTTTAPPLVALTVRSVTPPGAATGIATGSLVSVTFSVEPSPASPTPTLSPSVTGRWDRSGHTWTFHPLAGFLPGTKETVSVAKRTVADENGRRVSLAAAYHSTFTVGSGSTLRLQELLADLHYLPVTFTSAPSPATSGTTTSTAATSVTTFPAAAIASHGARTVLAPSTTATSASSSTVPAPTTSAEAATTTSSTVPTSTSTTAPIIATTKKAETTAAILTGIAAEPRVARDVSTVALPGGFTWAYGNIPKSLAAEWTEGKPDLMTKGAVMAFEADHGLGVDGVAGPMVWSALVKAVAARRMDPRPYNYIEVTENLPETLEVWQNGNNDVYSTPANTGAEGAATQLGTFPVYLRYTSHTMIGTNPDGTKYNDPGIPWIAYFNGGDAVHGYPRASYGFPQSNGCVELPIANAGAVFNSGEDFYGTLVNVT